MIDRPLKDRVEIGEDVGQVSRWSRVNADLARIGKAGEEVSYLDRVN
jgi:hypothetical protein